MEPEPLRLRAETPEDLEVIAALLHQAEVDVSGISWMRPQHYLLIPVNRQLENLMVGAALRVDGVLRVRARGIASPESPEPGPRLQVQGVEFRAGEGCAGEIRVHFADHAGLAIEVECVDAHLVDLAATAAAAEG